MTQIPIQKEVIDRIASQNKIANPGKASIREMRKMIQDVEKETGIRFVKMEMGIPGLPAPQVGVNAQIEALKSGVASIYPEIYGTADFKNEAARFVKNFLDIDVTPECCVPTVGSMQAGLIRPGSVLSCSALLFLRLRSCFFPPFHKVPYPIQVYHRFRDTE